MIIGKKLQPDLFGELAHSVKAAFKFLAGVDIWVKEIAHWLQVFLAQILNGIARAGSATHMH